MCQQKQISMTQKFINHISSTSCKTLEEKLKACNKQINQFVRLKKRKMSHNEQVAVVEAWESVEAYKQIIIADIISLRKFLENSKN